MGLDEMGVDKVGVDEMGGTTPNRQLQYELELE